MSTDARLSTGLPGHPKTKKLVRRLGPAAGWSLVCLILWARDNRQDGDLSGMTTEDIELAADWSGDNDAFVRELAAVGFLDGEEGAYQLHDWADHQPWSAGADLRSAKARWNAVKRHHGVSEADRQVPEYAAVRHATSTDSDATSMKSDAASNASSNARSTGVAVLHPRRSNAPSPSPSPSPSEELIPSDEGIVPSKPGTPACPHADIVALYHELLPELRQVREWGSDRQGFLRSRWREAPERQSLDWWRQFFAYVRDCPWLMGQGSTRPGEDPFLADLEWLIRPQNFRKVIEGKYARRTA